MNELKEYGALFHNRVLFSHKEEGNHIIYMKVCGNGGHYGKESQQDTVKQAVYVLSLI